MNQQSEEFKRGWSDGYDAATIFNFFEVFDETEDYTDGYNTGWNTGISDLEEQKYIEDLEDYEANNGIPSTIR